MQLLSTPVCSVPYKAEPYLKTIHFNGKLQAKYRS
jgi:hypothetical protein